MNEKIQFRRMQIRDLVAKDISEKECMEKIDKIGIDTCDAHRDNLAVKKMPMSAPGKQYIML